MSEAPRIGATFVKLKAPAAKPNPCLPPQTGPYPAPSDDVFGDWKITGFLNAFAIALPRFGAEWPTYQADLAECVDQHPGHTAATAVLDRRATPAIRLPHRTCRPGLAGIG